MTKLFAKYRIPEYGVYFRIINNIIEVWKDSCKVESKQFSGSPVNDLIELVEKYQSEYMDFIYLILEGSTETIYILDIYEQEVNKALKERHMLKMGQTNKMPILKTKCKIMAVSLVLLAGIGFVVKKVYDTIELD